MSSNVQTDVNAATVSRRRMTPREAAERAAWRINALAARYEETDDLIVTGAELVDAVFGPQASLSGCLAMLAAEYRRRGDDRRGKLYDDLSHAAYLDARASDPNIEI